MLAPAEPFVFSILTSRYSTRSLEQVGGSVLFIEVESNQNCETGFFGRFKEIRPARPVVQVKLYDRTPSGEWYWVTGWSDGARSPGCQAHARLVEDSGAGLTYLVYGGIHGLRFKPIDIEEAWGLDSPHQWGEAYLSLSSERDLRYAEEPSAPR